MWRGLAGYFNARRRREKSGGPGNTRKVRLGRLVCWCAIFRCALPSVSVGRRLTGDMASIPKFMTDDHRTVCCRRSYAGPHDKGRLAVLDCPHWFRRMQRGDRVGAG